MHYTELSLPSNTATLAQQCLSDSELIIRGKEQSIEEQLQIDPNKQKFYLYPDEDALELDQEFLSSLDDKEVHLIVPDGTWRQAKKIKRREPLLEQIPSIKIPISQRSIYTLRKQHLEFGLCTMEAVAFALGLIENKKIEEHLLKVLKIKNQRFEIGRDNQLAKVYLKEFP